MKINAFGSKEEGTLSKFSSAVANVKVTIFMKEKKRGGGGKRETYHNLLPSNQEALEKRWVTFHTI